MRPIAHDGLYSATCLVQINPVQAGLKQLKLPFLDNDHLARQFAFPEHCGARPDHRGGSKSVDQVGQLAVGPVAHQRDLPQEELDLLDALLALLLNNFAVDFTGDQAQIRVCDCPG